MEPQPSITFSTVVRPPHLDLARALRGDDRQLAVGHAVQDDEQRDRKNRRNGKVARMPGTWCAPSAEGPSMYRSLILD
jgi:hypothetical protein